MDEKLYINNINILKEIDSITNNDINKIYNIENIETNNKEYIWDLISTTLFLQDKQCGHVIFNEILDNKKSMKENVIESSFEYEDELCYFLDENNNPIVDLNDYNFNKLEIEYHMKEHENNLCKMDEYEYEKYCLAGDCFENSNLYDEKDISFNKCLLDCNGYIDYCKLVRNIRNSLAHSKYEILDEKYIRIYDKDKNGNYTFNIKVNNIVVINLIDVINKHIYKKVNDFDFMLNNMYDKYCMETDIDENSFIDDLLENGLKFMPNKETILIEVIKFLHNNNSLSDYFSVIGKIIEYNQNNLDLCLVLEDFLYDNFKNKSDDYNTFLYNRDFFGEVKNNNIKYNVLIYAFLINNFSRAYNENKEEFINNFNFDKFDLDYESLKNMNKEMDNKYKSFDNQIKSIENDYRKEEKKYKKNTEQLDNIINLNNLKQIEIFRKRIIENKQNLESLQNRKNLILSNRELSKERTKREFILKHLRNSLVHGNAVLPTNIDFNNLNNTYIQFYDYNTDKEKNNEQTFYAEIKIVELIDMLSKHETINNLYKVR
ncbi:MAG: hypothetical protein PUA68_07000 [Bacilli bacterium]|nr:hypothetical protein [Bacilli bacterium]